METQILAPSSKSAYVSGLHPASENTHNVDLVSHLGDRSSKAIFVQGDYAYVAVDSIRPELAVINVSQPITPTEVSGVSLPSAPLDLYVQATYAYVAMGSSGIAIVDVAAPVAPVVIGSLVTLGSAQSILVTGDQAYVAAGEAGLRILDVSVPAAPTEAGFADTPGTAEDVVVAGNYAYLADGTAGLRILDISDPATPSEVGAFSITDDPSAYASEVAVSGSYAYLAYGPASLWIIDISNPAMPLPIYTFPLASTEAVQAVAVVGSYAYAIKRSYASVIWDGVPYLMILDVSTEASPAQVSETDQLGGDSLAVIGNTVYVAGGRAGVRFGDVTDPAAPIWLSTWEGDPIEARAVVTMDGYAYVAEGSCWGTYTCGGGLRVIDVSNPEVPVDAYAAAGTLSHAIDVASRYAYLTATWRGGTEMAVWDVTNPEVPIRIGGYSQDTWTSYFSDVIVADEYAYVLETGWAGGAVIRLDISDPASPIEAGRVALAGANSIDLAGGYVYIAGDSAGLVILDAATLAVVGAHDTVGALDVAVAGNFAYLADGSAGLRVMDVTDPASPIEVGAYDTPGIAVDVKVEGRNAFVADSNAGVRVIDVAIPSAPIEIGFYDTPGDAQGLAVSGNYAYIADSMGFLVLQPFRDVVTASLTSNGGHLLSTDGYTHFEFFMGSFTQTVTLTFRHWMSDLNLGSRVGVGHTFDIAAVYSDTGQPAQLAAGQSYSFTVQYDEFELGPAIENTLALYYWDETQWVQAPTSTLDAANNRLMAASNQLALWTVFGDTNRMFIPILNRSP